MKLTSQHCYPPAPKFRQPVTLALSSQSDCSEHCTIPCALRTPTSIMRLPSSLVSLMLSWPKFIHGHSTSYQWNREERYWVYRVRTSRSPAKVWLKRLILFVDKRPVDTQQLSLLFVSMSAPVTYPNVVSQIFINRLYNTPRPTSTHVEFRLLVVAFWNNRNECVY